MTNNVSPSHEKYFGQTKYSAYSEKEFYSNNILLALLFLCIHNKFVHLTYVVGFCLFLLKSIFCIIQNKLASKNAFERTNRNTNSIILYDSRDLVKEMQDKNEKKREK